MSLGSVCVCVCVRVKKTERESVSTCCHHAFTVLKQLREETEEIRSELDEWERGVEKCISASPHDGVLISASISNESNLCRGSFSAKCTFGLCSDWVQEVSFILLITSNKMRFRQAMRRILASGSRWFITQRENISVNKNLSRASEELNPDVCLNQTNGGNSMQLFVVHSPVKWLPRVWCVFNLLNISMT